MLKKARKQLLTIGTAGFVGIVTLFSGASGSMIFASEITSEEITVEDTAADYAEEAATSDVEVKEHMTEKVDTTDEANEKEDADAAPSMRETNEVLETDIEKTETEEYSGQESTGGVGAANNTKNVENINVKSSVGTVKKQDGCMKMAVITIIKTVINIQAGII